eukprot:1149150-Pelagomonas_calceolata.AAC.3
MANRPYRPKVDKRGKGCKRRLKICNACPSRQSGIDMQCQGNNRTFLQQTMPYSRMHACVAECVPCKLLLHLLLTAGSP